MIRIRHQVLYRPYKRSSVEIISVDQFTKLARRLDKTKTEREHLLDLLNKFNQNEFINYHLGDTFAKKTDAFWIEKR